MRIPLMETAISILDEEGFLSFRPLKDSMFTKEEAQDLYTILKEAQSRHKIMQFDQVIVTQEFIDELQRQGESYAETAAYKFWDATLKTNRAVIAIKPTFESKEVSYDVTLLI